MRESCRDHGHSAFRDNTDLVSCATGGRRLVVTQAQDVDCLIMICKCSETRLLDGWQLFTGADGSTWSSRSRRVWCNRAILREPMEMHHYLLASLTTILGNLETHKLRLDGSLHSDMERSDMTLRTARKLWLSRENQRLKEDAEAIFLHGRRCAITLWRITRSPWTRRVCWPRLGIRRCRWPQRGRSVSCIPSSFEAQQHVGERHPRRWSCRFSMGPSNPRDDGNRVCEAIEVQPFPGITLAPSRARQMSVRLLCILELLKVPSACRKARGTRNLKGQGSCGSSAQWAHSRGDILGVVSMRSLRSRDVVWQRQHDTFLELSWPSECRPEDVAVTSWGFVAHVHGVTDHGGDQVQRMVPVARSPRSYRWRFGEADSVASIHFWCLLRWHLTGVRGEAKPKLSRTRKSKNRSLCPTVSATWAAVVRLVNSARRTVPSVGTSFQWRQYEFRVKTMNLIWVRNTWKDIASRNVWQRWG